MKKFIITGMAVAMLSVSVRRHGCTLIDKFFTGATHGTFGYPGRSR